VSYVCILLVSDEATLAWLHYHKSIRVVYSFLSLGYGKDILPRACWMFLKFLTTDVVLLLAVITLSYSRGGPRPFWSALVRTLVNDSALYFLVVAVSHSLTALFALWGVPCV